MPPNPTADVTFDSVMNHGLAATAELLTRGFEGYFVRLEFTPARLLEMVRTDSVDLAASRLVRVGGEPVGVGLIARRGWTSRLAGMALLPAARRRGLGRALVECLLAESRARGDQAMVLEVIEQNEPAVRLYTACGFTKVRRLVGFLGQPGGDFRTTRETAEVDLRTVAEAVGLHGAAALPWQLSAETIAQLTPPSRAFSLPGAWIAYTPVSDTLMAIRALVASTPRDGDGAARQLLAARMAQHPGASWRMTAIWPEEQATFFPAPCFERLELSQWQMQRSLVPAAAPLFRPAP